MKYQVALFAVKDIKISRAFYENVMNQKVVLDLGPNLTFTGGFALQENYPELVGVEDMPFSPNGNDHELYFEEEDFDGFVERLKGIDGIDYVHPPKEYPWGQRVMRFHDPDRHIIEVGEPMETVFKRFASQGMNVEQIAERTMCPLPFIQQFIA